MKIGTLPDQLMFTTSTGSCSLHSLWIAAATLLPRYSTCRYVFLDFQNELRWRRPFLKIPVAPCIYGHVPKRLACNRALGPHPLHTPLHRVCNRGRFSRHTRRFLSCIRHEGCATRVCNRLAFQGVCNRGLVARNATTPLFDTPPYDMSTALNGVPKHSRHHDHVDFFGSRLKSSQTYMKHVCGTTGSRLKLRMYKSAADIC